MEPQPHRFGQHPGLRDRGRGWPQRLLRPLRRAARHGPEPHPAAAVPGGDGAAGLAGRRPHPRREGQGAARPAPVHRRRGAAPHRARALHRRPDRRPAGAGLRATGRQRGGDLRRGDRAYRQLALGGSAVPPGHRQAHGRAFHRGHRDPQAGQPLAVRAPRRRPCRPQPADLPAAAAGRHRAGPDEQPGRPGMGHPGAASAGTGTVLADRPRPPHRL